MDANTRLLAKNAASISDDQVPIDTRVLASEIEIPWIIVDEQYTHAAQRSVEIAPVLIAYAEVMQARKAWNDSHVATSIPDRLGVVVESGIANVFADCVTDFVFSRCPNPIVPSRWIGYTEML